MPAHEDVYIIVAAYNEEKKIAHVIDDLHSHGYSNIVVIDDCSRDNTSQVARAKGATVLRHIINRGQGASLKTGIDYALLKGASYIVTFDGDGQMQAADIHRMLAPVLSGEVEVALGSRFLGSAENIPSHRRLVLKAGVIFLRMFYGIRLTDAQNGFRVFSRAAAELISIQEDQMEHASEILGEIHKKRIPYKEIPVTIKYSDYSKKKGQSSLNSIRIALKLMLRKLMN